MGDSMSGFVVAGDSSGAITLVAPDTAGTNTITLQANTGTVALVSDITTAISNLNFNANSIGISQSWQSPSRAAGVTYTNSTGRPIMINVTFRTPQAAGPEITGTLIVDSVTVGSVGGPVSAPVHHPISAIVPPGSTYRATVSGSSTVVGWAELR